MATNQALERKLWSFAEESLKPSEESLEKAASVINKIVTVFQRSSTKSKYKIAKIIPAGSYGKSTSLSQHFDIDLVAFVNGRGPPFKEVLKDFEDVIDLAEDFHASDVHDTRHSIQFKLDGFEIDLLPARNYTEGMQLSNEEEIKQQKILALADIQSKYDRKEKYDSSFSSALADSQVKFIQEQSAFVHSLIRLCKFWMKTLQLDYIFGKSFMIELMATKVGQDEENNRHKPSMTKGFLAFLDSMIHFNKIFIDFNPDGRTPNQTKQLPVIMDPTNPYNNIASNIEKNTILKLIDYAKETCKRVIHWEQSSFLADLMLLEVLFDPQPRLVQPSRGIPVPIALVGIHGAVKHYHPKMVVNKGCKFDKIELEDFKRRVHQSIVTKMQAMTAGAKSGTSSLDVKNMVKNQVNRQILGVEEKRWSYSSENHEDYDVTFILPFLIEGCPKSCWVSFKK